MEAERDLKRDIFCREEIIGASTVAKVGAMRIVLSMDGVAEYHFLIIPIRHVDDASLLSVKESEDFTRAVRSAAKFYASRGINGYKLVLLSGPEAGQTIPHLHWHMIPGNSEFVTDPKQRKIHYSVDELNKKAKELSQEFTAE